MSEGALGRVEARARLRYHRFSARAWEDWVEHGARPLAAALASAPGWTDTERVALLETAAELGAEAVGLGYLHVPAPGAAQDGWFARAFGPLLSERLPRRRPSEALSELVELWNLSEALETGAPWLRNLLAHFAHRLVPEVSLREFVRGVDSAVGEEGLRPLGGSASDWETAWLAVAPQPTEALPGQVAFLAPRVVAVQLRGTDRASLFLLKPEPTLLGTGPWTPGDGLELTVRRRRAAGHPDLLAWRRAGELHAEAETPYAWVGSPRLSQRVLFAWRAA